MKKTLLLGLTLMIGAKVFAQSIPNGGFENWNSTTWMDPMYYMTSNEQSNNGYSNTLPDNAVRITKAFHGNYAIQLTCVKIGGDTIAGYVIDGNPNGSVVQGGIPYAQMAKGISLHYKYTIKSKDTALILAFFKLKGAVVGQYFFPVSDTTSQYKLFTGTFSPALSVTPDTVVFGAATSTKVVGSGKGIPGSVLTIDSVNFTGVASQPADLNGDFENWVADTSWTPVGWYSLYVGVNESTDAFAGKYSCELTTTNSNNNGVQAGNVSTGYYVCPQNCSGSCNCVEEGGYAYTLQTDTLFFEYKYAPTAGDTAAVALSFLKNGNTSGTGMNYLSTGGNWMQGKIGYTNGISADTLIVTAVSSSHNANGQLPAKYVGSVFKIDNMYLKSQPLSVANLTQAGAGIKVYPNPAGQLLYIDYVTAGGPIPASVAVVDMLGNDVVTMQHDLNAGPVKVNITGLASGVYFVKITTESSVSITKFVKE
ncbi:MAG TPA: T9SS type A sorting domain-containing protein [Bacteroidia bacterium]|nr:T9SS type A sorting domain-containing protein [Bacteroidia bacterium]